MDRVSPPGGWLDANPDSQSDWVGEGEGGVQGLGESGRLVSRAGPEGGQLVGCGSALQIRPLDGTASAGRWTEMVTAPTDSPGRAVNLFTPPDVHNTTTLLLSEGEETLFVGARDALLSVSVGQGGSLILNSKLDWSPTKKDLNDCSMKGKEETDCPNFVRVLQVLNSTHMYACGTFAFSPRCTYINSQSFSLVTSAKPEEGRGRCPYDPYQKNTAITVDGELYTGTVADYRGTRPVISRHLSEGDHVDMKLDDTLGWLEDPTFISSASIPSENKVYFFFSEIGREYDFIERFTVSRIAQVCTSDVGGQRTLQRRWTTFTKAQLLCQASGELPYNVLQDMTTLKPAGGAADDTLFFGIFSSQWTVNSGRSAVCAFSLRTIKDVFAGNYKHLNRETLKWTMRLQEKITNPGEANNMLRFVKENFLADINVLPVNQELTMVSPHHHYSNIVAQRVQGARGKEYTVLYLLTAETGFLHKVVLLEKGVHIIEEIQVFTQPQMIKNLLLSTSKGVVLVGSSEGVVSVPISNCSYYWNCAECVLARDPFCGWDPVRKACASVSSIKENVGQDVDNGNAFEVCRSPITPRSRSGTDSSLLRTTGTPCPPGELVSVSLNEVVRLRCPAPSQLAQLHWERPNSQISPKIYMQHEDGSLSFLATPSTLGQYNCKAKENGFTQTLIMYQVKQKSSPTLQPLTPNRAQVTPLAETERGTVGSTTKWVTTMQAKEETMPPKPNTNELQPTVPVMETPAVTPSKHNRTSISESEHLDRLEVESTGGEPQLLTKTPSYLRELVAVSVLLALCISALLTIALFSFRQRYYSRTTPHSPGSQRSGGTPPQEREALRGSSQSEGKRNGHGNNLAKSPNTLSNGMLNGSNGHLPNTPI
ncbi:hypothetical protein NFI96_028205 [Prochilodus magdalenae]|nr:hypothetical protein NFI96_028205 [Prochilodus magdalenae]